MTKLWLLFAVLSPLLYSLGNILDKFLIAKKVKNPFSYAIISGSINLLIAFILAYIIGLPKLSQNNLLVAIIIGFLYGFVVLIYYKVISYAEVSRLVGVMYLYTVLTAIFSRIFLGEQLPFIKYLFIVIAFIGVYLLSLEKGKIVFKISKFLWIMFIYALIIALADVGNKYLLSDLSFWEVFIIFTIITNIVVLGSIFSKNARKNIPKNKSTLFSILIVQIIQILALLSFFKAASLAKIAIVSAIASLQPVFVFLITLFLSILFPKILKENLNKKVLIYKIIGIILVTLSAIVISS